MRHVCDETSEEYIAYHSVCLRLAVEFYEGGANATRG